MKNKLIAALFLLVTYAAQAQSTYYNAENKEKIKSLNHLVGTWEGEGWIMSQKTREKIPFQQKEEVYYRLDSSIIEVHGIGLNQDKIVHDALAIISNKPDSDYTMNSFVGDGRTGEFEMKVDGERLIWEIPVDQGIIRYTILVNENTWTEKGDFGMNGNWYSFFEMNLNRID